jgi:hypothetical protein
VGPLSPHSVLKRGIHRDQNLIKLILYIASAAIISPTIVFVPLQLRMSPIMKTRQMVNKDGKCWYPKGRLMI